MSTRKIRVAITHGDINGIGYEVVLKIFEDERILELFTPILYGSSHVANFWRRTSASSMSLGRSSVRQAKPRTAC